MKVPWIHTLLSGRGDVTVTECRHCGESLDTQASQCPTCGRSETVTYEIS